MKALIKRKGQEWQVINKKGLLDIIREEFLQSCGFGSGVDIAKISDGIIAINNLFDGLLLNKKGIETSRVIITPKETAMYLLVGTTILVGEKDGELCDVPDTAFEIVEKSREWQLRYDEKKKRGKLSDPL